MPSGLLSHDSPGVAPGRSAVFVPALRLVGHDPETPTTESLSTGPTQSGHLDHARRAIERANQHAASMSALDARWVLAVQVSRSLTGGRAAILRPEARERLLGLGARVGLRPFDTSLVIAIVQDAARSGDDELGRDVVGRLTLVRAGGDVQATMPMSLAQIALRVVIVVGLAALLAYAATRWIVA